MFSLLYTSFNKKAIPIALLCVACTHVSRASLCPKDKWKPENVSYNKFGEKLSFHPLHAK